ncbi:MULTISPECIES: hypothetical protein [unclassified Paraburkholderia]|uniref:hypothetical protein n=1 Tax=unclassified Paraburkholderia TaxID=2615204 RepID=UPI00160E9220|nr:MULTISPECIES: hypothetical protein [unclassified Paraburkholderia]MBB5412991.1 hypothetical protein [Paraburkholderia sp. HC6.4b]MBB5455270.1 hypothetical protein [Paraburkholderia sp. Kb1A]MBC8740282.1 hypothetical protein [Paraburkholderia sp. UCT31]
MATNITITETRGASASAPTATAATPSRKLPGWLWFIALWCFGVTAAMSLGFAFKLLMNATLFAVR